MALRTPLERKLPAHHPELLVARLRDGEREDPAWVDAPRVVGVGVGIVVERDGFKWPGRDKEMSTALRGERNRLTYLGSPGWRRWCRARTG